MRPAQRHLRVKVPDGFGGVWLADDDSIILSASTYNEFVRPYNERVLLAFGGGCVHYCGNSTQNIQNYCNTKGLTAINDFTTVRASGPAQHIHGLQRGRRGQRLAEGQQGPEYFQCLRFLG